MADNVSLVFKNAGDENNITCDGIVSSPPFYNKDIYTKEFESIEEYSRLINRAFSVDVNNKIMIDYKPVKDCSLDDFIGMLPFKPTSVDEVNFGGMGRKSIHYLIVKKM